MYTYIYIYIMYIYILYYLNVIIYVTVYIYIYSIIYLEVSWTGGTAKWFILVGFSIIKPSILGTFMCGNT